MKERKQYFVRDVTFAVVVAKCEQSLNSSSSTSVPVQTHTCFQFHLHRFHFTHIILKHQPQCLMFLDSLNIGKILQYLNISPYAVVPHLEEHLFFNDFLPLKLLVKRIMVNIIIMVETSYKFLIVKRRWPSKGVTINERFYCIVPTVR